MHVDVVAARAREDNGASLTRNALTYWEKVSDAPIITIRVKALKLKNSLRVTQGRGAKEDQGKAH